MAHNNKFACVEAMEQKEIKQLILAEAEKGNVCFWTMEGIQTAPLEQFVKQPAEGILYDLNRSQEVVLTFLENPKWVNDYAVALTIKKLKEMIEAGEQVIAHDQKDGDKN